MLCLIFSSGWTIILVLDKYCCTLLDKTRFGQRAILQLNYTDDISKLAKGVCGSIPVKAVGYRATLLILNTFISYQTKNQLEVSYIYENATGVSIKLSSENVFEIIKYLATNCHLVSFTSKCVSQ